MTQAALDEEQSEMQSARSAEPRSTDAYDYANYHTLSEVSAPRSKTTISEKRGWGGVTVDLSGHSDMQGTCERPRACSQRKERCSKIPTLVHSVVKYLASAVQNHNVQLRSSLC